MAVAAGLSLIWTRALVETMGGELYGLFLTFLVIAQLGGVGDLGLGGAIGFRLLGHLARGEDEAGKRLLANARGAFGCLVLVLALIFCLGSPWLPAAFRFEDLPGAGSLPLLFIVGGVGVAVVVISGYLHNVNYVLGNVVWPVIPAFVFSQVSVAGQLLLARANAPLWALYTIHVATSIAVLLLTLVMIRVSHGWAGSILPIRLELRETRLLAATSFWVYLASLGDLVYVTTDRILINAGFGAGAVPPFQLNYRLCELAVSFVTAASYVALPAIATRLLSPALTERQQGIEHALKLQRLQAFFACAAGGTYLAINDAFIAVWLGPQFHVPLAWQFAFALNLAVTIAGSVGIQLLGRLDHSAVRAVGLTMGGTGLLNFGLSLLAMKTGSILGIALATVVAQSVASLVMSYGTCRRLGVPWSGWMQRAWLLPVTAITILGWARATFPPTDLPSAALFGGILLVWLLAAGYALGLRRQMVVDEWERLCASFR